MQLRVLKLEDGEYAKANGGFSLIRSGFKKPEPSPPAPAKQPVSSSSQASTYWIMALEPSPVSPMSHLDAVDIGGIKYLVANGGKSLQRFGSNSSSLSTANRIPKRLTSATYENAHSVQLKGMHHLTDRVPVVRVRPQPSSARASPDSKPAP